MWSYCHNKHKHKSLLRVFNEWVSYVWVFITKEPSLQNCESRYLNEAFFICFCHKLLCVYNKYTLLEIIILTWDANQGYITLNPFIKPIAKWLQEVWSQDVPIQTHSHASTNTVSQHISCICLKPITQNIQPSVLKEKQQQQKKENIP